MTPLKNLCHPTKPPLLPFSKGGGEWGYAQLRVIDAVPDLCLTNAGVARNHMIGTQIGTGGGAGNGSIFATLSYD